jgi:hypothetical protein
MHTSGPKVFINIYICAYVYIRHAFFNILHERERERMREFLLALPAVDLKNSTAPSLLNGQLWRN